MSMFFLSMAVRVQRQPTPFIFSKVSINISLCHLLSPVLERYSLSTPECVCVSEASSPATDTPPMHNFTVAYYSHIVIGRIRGRIAHKLMLPAAVCV